MLITKEAELTAHVSSRDVLQSLALACKTTAEQFDEAHDKLKAAHPEDEDQRHLLDEQARYFTALYAELKEGFGL